MKKTLILVLGLSALVLLAVAQPVLADGIIIPEPPQWPEPPPLRETWLTIRYHRVSVTIDDQVATTRVEQAFLNEHDWEAEGTYVFPLPHGAAVSEFMMWVDGEPIESTILEAEQARAIYEGIVRRRRDPALLEYVGQAAVQARVFPIPSGETRQVELEYTQVLPMENGLVRYVYPLRTERFSARPVEEVSIRVDVHSADAMRAIYSPTHQGRIHVDRDASYGAAVEYEEMDVVPTEDFELIYTVSEEDVGLNLLTFREDGEDGYYLLLVAPKIDAARDEIVSRDIVLVLDTSGSMEGVKIDQAKEALAYVLEHLHGGDRFGVIAFSTGLNQYARSLRSAGDARDAADWVRMLEAAGGTDINRALLEALALVAQSDRPAVIIFLTDGLPTEGVIAIDEILSNVGTCAPRNARIFAFGVGDDVNTVLLDALSQQNRGSSSYVRPDERIDEAVSSFYRKVSTPVLSDVSIEMGNVLAQDAYPDPLPDLFAGTQLVVAGRYRDYPGDGPQSIILSGQVDGQHCEFAYEGHFRSEEGGERFIPRLWATRKIGHLLTKIRLHGRREEWVDAVIALSIRYGIITPYTSFLIDEDDVLTQSGRDDAAEEFIARAPPAQSGEAAVEKASDEAQLRGAETAAALTTPDGLRQNVHVVGHKTFVLLEGVWTDTAFDPSRMTTAKVVFGGEDYFGLLARQAGWGDFLALGDRVIFTSGAQAFEVVPETEALDLPVQGTPTAEPPLPSSIDPIDEAVLPAAPTSSDIAAPRAGGRLCAAAPLLLSAAAGAYGLARRSRI